MSQGAWQKWDDKEYLDYLERYYGMQFMNTSNILKSAMMEESEELFIAVFNKIASPSVYLQPHYKAWLAKKNDKSNKIIEKAVRRSPPPKGREPPTPQPDKWKPTKTEGTFMCSERYVTDEELAKAKDTSDASMWYSKPGEGYRWGLVFRKVKA